MEVMKQDGYLIWMDQLDPGVKKGMVMQNQTGLQVVVVYVDRDEELLGILPLDEL